MTTEVDLRARRITTCLAIATMLVMIPAGPGRASTFTTTGAEFGYTHKFPDSQNSEGSGSLRDVAADDRCAWLKVSWDKPGGDPTSTHVVCRRGNSVAVSLTQHTDAHYLDGMTLKLCRIQRGRLSDCQEQHLDNPNH